MDDLIAALGLGIASALVPLINIEAYLGFRAGVGGLDGVWLIGFVAAVGQMLGKVAWYYLGANALSWGWVGRRMDTPTAKLRLDRWRTRTQERPVLAGGLVLVSALVGLPPFAVVAVLAGQLRMGLALFLALGLLGRWLRFAAVLGGAGWLTSVLAR